MYNLIIKNGVIIDGTGRPVFSSDIGIVDGKIKQVGKLEGEPAEEIIDAKGKYVAPGFIDVNNHSDTYWRIFSGPRLESLLYQGITTIIGGNCGSSLAPLANKNIIQSVQKWTDISRINLNWLKADEFLTVLEKKQLPVNFGTLIGHSTLRRGIVGDQVRTLTEEELATTKNMLAEAMEEGALGLSTGLVYTHAKSASFHELVELAKVVAQKKGVFAIHIRGEGSGLIESVQEAIKIAQESGVNLEISHLKAMGEKNWENLSKALEMIEQARENGININFDVYPYTYTGSVLYTVLPDWVAEGGKRLMVKRLQDHQIREGIIKEMKKDGFDYSKITVSISPLDKTLINKSVAEIAKSQGKSVEETVIDILIASEGRVVTMMDVLSEDNLKKAMAHPLSFVASNGSGYNLAHKETGELVHPRSFGSFPRALGKYVREERLLGWEEMIKKMTGGPAQKYGLERRGTIAKNNWADLVIFDPKKVQDFSNPENPYQYSQGIDYVLVNGEVVLSEGTLIEKKPGQVLRK